MKLTSQLLLGGLAAFILTVPLMADEIYTYTGPEYDVCSGAYATSSPPTCNADYHLTITFELTSPLADGLSLYTTGDFTDSSPELVAGSWSFTDGTNTVNSSNLSSPSALELAVTTNGSGDIVDWVLGAGSSAVEFSSMGHIGPPSASSDYTYLAPFVAYGAGGSCAGCTVGSWVASSAVTPPSGVPEPGNLALVGIGLVGIGLVRRKMRQRNQPVA
jgi:PEP-CTERM motif